MCGRPLLDEHSAAHALQVERAGARRRTAGEHAQVLLLAEGVEGTRGEGGRDHALDEERRHRVGRRVVYLHRECNHGAERAHRIARECLAIRVERVAADGKSARRRVLHDRAGHCADERVRGEQRALEVEQVVEGELLAAELRQRRQARARFLHVEGGALSRVLSIAE